MRYQDVFKRYEKKYLLTRAQYSAVRTALSGKMEQDAYGKHTILNLYFDTPQYDLIRHSLDKPDYKEKLRLRSYGVPQIHDHVFVEIKKKADGIVYKRRVQMPLNQAYAYLLGGIAPVNKNQITQEIDWLLARKPLQPQVFIGYDRIALAGIEDPELRVTFDQNLRYRRDPLDLLSGDAGKPICSPKLILMELKIADSIPVWLSRILSHLQIYPVSFSKYGACYTSHLCPAAQPARIAEGGVICA